MDVLTVFIIHILTIQGGNRYGQVNERTSRMDL